MFSKILIANRGEIACRVIRTAGRLGIKTVAVYSDADVGAQHVIKADEAVRLGPPPAADSYLNIDAVIKAALRTGAEAIHPGYGFLSENPGFVEAVKRAGIQFVGPSSESIKAMGLKDAAKRVMEESGIPVVPGYHGDNQAPDFLERQAGSIGYPVLIKARAGGGGKGMRRVERAGNFSAALEGARREALASFGDGMVLIEKYVSRPRHIEIQVFADSHGNAVHLFERDCSLQRRHQKVIEEAPAPGMTDQLRNAMGEAAVRAAQAIGYCGAGTVEFIVDSSDGLRADRFYFMEMNTRLQVEHPVTEFITGQDLVEWQLKVAAGDPLPCSQDALAIDGWAFEARIYAEDTAREFLPSTGRLHRLEFPMDQVRVDTGVMVGDEISPFYDPMIAKLIVHGPDRTTALNTLTAALANTFIAGTTTNVDFLVRLSANNEFRQGDVDTGLIGRHLDELISSPQPDAESISMAALAAMNLLEQSADEDPWSTLRGWRHWTGASQIIKLEHENATLSVEVSIESGDKFTISVADCEHRIQLLSIQGTQFHFRCDEILNSVRIHQKHNQIVVRNRGVSFSFTAVDHLDQHDQSGSGGDHVIAPMAGLVRLISTSTGKRVSLGDALIVMEAMKMEHILVAPRDGVVKSLLCAEGEQVSESTVLLELEADDLKPN